MEKQCRSVNLAVYGDLESPLLGIFVKEPVAGEVKTRLCPPLTPGQAATLYAVALDETVERFVAAGYRVVLFYAGNRAYFAEHFAQLPLIEQAGGDLGERLEAAMETLLACGSPAALIGSDSPDLPLSMVEEAFAQLAAGGVVTIPAADGGYVLIGCAENRPAIFHDIPWSSDAVLQTTRQRADQIGVRYAETGGWSDIDDAAALRALLGRSPGSKTAAHIRNSLEEIITAPAGR